MRRPGRGGRAGGAAAGAVPGPPRPAARSIRRRSPIERWRTRWPRRRSTIAIRAASFGSVTAGSPSSTGATPAPRQRSTVAAGAGTVARTVGAGTNGRAGASTHAVMDVLETWVRVRSWNAASARVVCSMRILRLANPTPIRQGSLVGGLSVGSGFSLSRAPRARRPPARCRRRPSVHRGLHAWPPASRRWRRVPLHRSRHAWPPASRRWRRRPASREAPDFGRRQAPDGTGRDVEPHRADADADEPDDRCAHGAEHPADLALPPLCQRDPVPRGTLRQGGPGEPGEADRLGPGGGPQRGERRVAFLERDPVGERRALRRIERDGDRHRVLAFDAVAGMEDLLRPRPVVREQQEALRIPVEATDGIEADARPHEPWRHEVEDGRRRRDGRPRSR